MRLFIYYSHELNEFVLFAEKMKTMYTFRILPRKNSVLPAEDIEDLLDSPWHVYDTIFSYKCEYVGEL